MAQRERTRVLFDTNVFVAAVKDPRRETSTFRLIVALLQREDVELVGDDILAEEYLRYAQAFPSPTAAALAAAIIRRMDIVSIDERFLAACRPYVPEAAAADLVHASACLKTGAILVSSDRHFESIRKAGLVSVMRTTVAIREWASSTD